MIRPHIIVTKTLQATIENQKKEGHTWLHSWLVRSELCVNVGLSYKMTVLIRPRKDHQDELQALVVLKTPVGKRFPLTVSTRVEWLLVHTPGNLIHHARCFVPSVPRVPVASVEYYHLFLQHEAYIGQHRHKPGMQLPLTGAKHRQAPLQDI